MLTDKEKAQKAAGKAAALLDKAAVPYLLFVITETYEEDRTFDEEMLNSKIKISQVYPMLRPVFTELAKDTGKKSSELAREFYNYVRRYERDYEWRAQISQNGKAEK